MINTEPAWERRVAELWATFDDHDPEDFLSKVQELTDELPAGDAVAHYELASAHDSIGNEAEAAFTGRLSTPGSPAHAAVRRRSSSRAPYATSGEPKRASIY
ncbi:hypothetical protein [Actinomadura sp. 7K507]|uniref:hypothetical protein n=1 Tax=Actinomadura sp. 7K507 TaxID=2530365 RepID=UPI001FB64B00|nr:hypothetical protein [Actinomadura sp. 7K507]